MSAFRLGIRKCGSQRSNTDSDIWDYIRLCHGAKYRDVDLCSYQWTIKLLENLVNLLPLLISSRNAFVRVYSRRRADRGVAVLTDYKGHFDAALVPFTVTCARHNT